MPAYLDGGGADPLFGGRDPDEEGGGPLCLPFGGGATDPLKNITKKLPSFLFVGTLMGAS